MIFHAYYTDVPRAEIDRLVDAQELGRLVTVGADGTPHIGLYPFVRDGETVDLHLVRADEQIADLRERSTCVFELDDVLGVIPSYWVHKEYAGSARRTTVRSSSNASPRSTRIRPPSQPSSSGCSTATSPKAAIA